MVRRRIWTEKGRTIPTKQWVITAYQEMGSRGLRTLYCARNMCTGEWKPSRKTYTEALADIPVGEQVEGHYAEPWGV